ncbi:OmpA family protein [Roseibium sp. CAU 1637]|uniref:OmpA family protein n=1 Tax=Roseibium limicola TaxID=2816037 RepID=A0A939ERZ2_9HYPH|nr:OmpA family protein [Roseibium limicola]MBO0347012.1 OmpA family protein [Roseibium limicola]
MNFLDRRGARLLSLGLFFGLSWALAACGNVSSLTTPDVTNATAPGFVDMKPGSEEDFMLNVGRRIYFSEGSSEISDEAQMSIDRQAVWLKRNPKWLVKIQGHADEPGGDAANKTLSTKRADAVMAALVVKGVAAKRMWTKGYGIERPVTDCSDITCTSQNRRVVVNLREEFDESAPRR